MIVLSRKHLSMMMHIYVFLMDEAFEKVVRQKQEGIVSV